MLSPPWSCQAWLSHATDKKRTVINRLYLLCLPLSFFLVTDENSESDSDTEEKLKGKASVWRKWMAPDKLCSEILGQDRFSMFCLRTKSLFPPRTQWQNKDLNTAEENPWAEDYRSPTQTSVPIPTKALCTAFPSRGLGHWKYSEVFLRTQPQMCDQADRGSTAWDRVFRKCLLREKTHQPDWLGRKTGLRCMIYC